MTNDRRYADLTKHPGIFRKVYWGNVMADNLPDDAIVINRNTFVAEYGVTRFVSGDIPKSQDRMFDHAELYRCECGFVYIVSPYDADAEMHELAASMGLTQYKPLYHPRATTYIKQFSDKHEFDRWKKCH